MSNVKCKPCIVLQYWTCNRSSFITVISLHKYSVLVLVYSYQVLKCRRLIADTSHLQHTRYQISLIKTCGEIPKFEVSWQSVNTKDRLDFVFPQWNVCFAWTDACVETDNRCSQLVGRECLERAGTLTSSPPHSQASCQTRQTLQNILLKCSLNPHVMVS